MEDEIPPNKLTLYKSYYYEFCLSKDIDYYRTKQLRQRESGDLYPAWQAPSSPAVPVLFGFLLVLSSNFHIFGTKL